MFSSLSNNASNPQDDVARAANNNRNGRVERRGGLAASTLRKAGLVDQDSGMRDASRAGPSRARGAGGKGASSSRNTLDQPTSAATRTGSRARDRANPLGRRPGRNQSQNDGSATAPSGVRAGAAVRGVALRGSSGKAKAKGRDARDVRNSGTIATLRQFLASRWQEEAKYLNLDSMASDPILLAGELKPPGSVGAPKDLANVIFKLTRELYPSIVTLSLANNDFKSLVPILGLTDYLPKLKNLSLQGNDLKWTKDLSALTGKRKFEALSELVLLENPVQANAVAAGNEAGYRSEVLAKFPTLKMLDMKPVEPAEANLAALPQAKSSAQGLGSNFAGIDPMPFPLAVQAGFSDEQANVIIPTFLSTFFAHMDSDRKQLKAAYTSKACMTFTLALSVPPRAKAEGFYATMKNQKRLDNDRLKKLDNHDVMRLGTHSASRGLHSGAERIVAFLERLPKSRHPLQEASKFVVDAWVLPNDKIGATVDGGERPTAVLFINVHGEYLEFPSHGVRSFDRTFTVAPAPPGSASAAAGWPCVILNEQFTIRQYAGSSAWTPKAPAAVAPAAPPSEAIQQQQQQEAAAKLAAQTGMTLPFAIQCLEQNGWNYDLAFANFNELKAANSIPPEAFAPTVS